MKMTTQEQLAHLRSFPLPFLEFPCDRGKLHTHTHTHTYVYINVFSVHVILPSFWAFVVLSGGKCLKDNILKLFESPK